MLKFRATFALWLLVSPTHTYTQTNKPPQATRGDKPSYRVEPAVQEHKDNPVPQPEAGKHVEADVRVVSTPARDNYDKATVGISVVLGLVGIGGVVAALLTLRKIKDQADEMHLQRIAMETTLRAINKQATLMEGQLEEMRKASEIGIKTLILQYRPRIIVRHATAKAFSKEISEGVLSEPVRCVVAFQIVNIGGAPAHIVDGDIYLLSARSSGLEEEIEFKESTHVGIGQRTLRPGERETIEFGLDTRIPNDARWVEFYDGQSSHSIFLLGTIWYRDDIEIPRQTGLRRAYDPKTKMFMPLKDSEEEYSD